MKKRLANKILNHTILHYDDGETNYQPYSIPSQLKAFKVLGMEPIYLYGKTPTEFRKFNWSKLDIRMTSLGMNPRTIKEYRNCMIELLKREEQ